ncbi:MAG: LysR family transcriptional regulator substrate-binding protein, partial [Planctomycetia bacterium]|nr:LysR family transcriptional regulator substrate-binding protein [Planctomycetia bacterium]
NSVSLPDKDVWGIVLRKDHPLSGKKAIAPEDLLDVSLIVSRYMIRQERVGNPYQNWFGSNLEKLNVVATYNLIYNAAILVESGLGCAITIDKLVNVTGNRSLCFRPFSPLLESGLDIVWKKYQVFSPAAAIFLEKITEKYGQN